MDKTYLHYLSALLQTAVYDLKQNNHKPTFYGKNLKLFKPNILNNNYQKVENPRFLANRIVSKDLYL